MSTPVFLGNEQRGNSGLTIAPARSPAPIIYSRGWAAALFIVDLSLFILSFFVEKLIAERVWDVPPTSRVILGDAIMVSFWILWFRALGLYQRTYAFRMRDELYYTVAALSLGVMPLLIVFTIFPQISTSRVGALFALGLSIVFVGAGRALMHGVRRLRVFRKHDRIAVVGTGMRIREAIASLELRDSDAPLLMEVEDIDATITSVYPAVNGAIERIDWFARAVAAHCDTLIFTEMVKPQFLPGILDVAARYRMRVAFAPPRIKRHSFSLSLETNGNQALIVARQLNACMPSARLTKRIMDIVLGSLALILFSPIMLACAIAVNLESGRPILFRQERVGMNGKTFNMLKFRSMRVNAETDVGAIWVRENDDRRTRVGSFIRRFSFDELPQLFNVLRGDMSLVGPRPERPMFVESFRAVLERYDERHLVCPGITGWSQIQMRRILQTSDVAEKLDYDLRYVEQWSILLDVSILTKTAVEFLFHRAG
jgi:exopolysaccharide biosynthesis polyprenyl glycosylphosphotransferase